MFVCVHVHMNAHSVTNSRKIQDSCILSLKAGITVLI